MKTRLFIILAALAALVLSSGCVVTEYHGQHGESFKRTAIGNKQSIGKVRFNPTTGEFYIEGYANDQTETAAAVAGAVAAAFAPKVP